MVKQSSENPVNLEEPDMTEDPDQALMNETLSYTDVNRFITELKELIDTHKTPPMKLQEYIKQFEVRVGHAHKKTLENVDRAFVKSLIERHPYFKNPSNYAIRLITIMKYLKKKGVDIHIHDMDLLVDQIVQSIEGVKKTDYGKYIRKGRF